MKILITGAYGLVGSEAMEFFEERGWDVVGIDNNMRSKLFGTPSHVGGKVLAIDIRDRDDLHRVFAYDGSFDAIIHAAAQPSHDWAKDHVITDFEINALGTLNLLELTRKYCPNATFVYVSTDKVYGENMTSYAQIPFKEDLGLDFAGKRSLFGCSKAAADIYVQEYGNYFGMKTVCFRPGCITGSAHEGAEYHGFLAYLTKCVKEGIPYTIFGEPTTVRDQIHAFDLVNAFWHFIKEPKIGAVYNIGGGTDRSISIAEAIIEIERRTGKQLDIKYGEKRVGDRVWDVHDCTKFMHDYPQWGYAYSLSDILDELCV